MNIFAIEKFDDQGKVCTFYTVRWEGSLLSETDKFFNLFKKDDRLKSSLQELAKFLEIVIGDEKGAIVDFFRQENKAHALPPKGSYLVEEVVVSFYMFPLRLYCLRISDSLVILFNGAEKTSKNAQQGKTSMVFYEANLFAKRIIEAIHQNEIYITPDNRELRSFNWSEEIYL